MRRPTRVLATLLGDSARELRHVPLTRGVSAMTLPRQPQPQQLPAQVRVISARSALGSAPRVPINLQTISAAQTRTSQALDGILREVTEERQRRDAATSELIELICRRKECPLRVVAEPPSPAKSE